MTLSLLYSVKNAGLDVFTIVTVAANPRHAASEAFSKVAGLKIMSNLTDLSVDNMADRL